MLAYVCKELPKDSEAFGKVNSCYKELITTLDKSCGMNIAEEIELLQAEVRFPPRGWFAFLTVFDLEHKVMSPTDSQVDMEVIFPISNRTHYCIINCHFCSGL